MKVTFQFSGGLELVTETTETVAEIDATEMKMSDIIPYVQKNFVKSQSQPFIKGNTVSVFQKPLPNTFFKTKAHFKSQFMGAQVSRNSRFDQRQRLGAGGRPRLHGPEPRHHHLHHHSPRRLSHTVTSTVVLPLLVRVTFFPPIHSHKFFSATLQQKHEQKQCFISRLSGPT